MHEKGTIVTFKRKKWKPVAELVALGRGVAVGAHASRGRGRQKATIPTAMRFELTRAKPSRFLVYRLNHSATLSVGKWSRGGFY